MREAAGIKVRSSPLLYTTSRAQIMMIRIQSALKGKDQVAPGSLVEALVFPRGGGGGEWPRLTLDEAYEEYKQTGQWPAYWDYPEIGPNEPQIFFLDKVRERDPRVDERSGVAEVTGITNYHLGKNFYVYARSLETTPSMLSMAKKYVEINNIKDPEQREEELLQFSMSLIEDRQTPETFATYATTDLGVSLYWKKPGYKWLTESRLDRLIAVAVDRSRPGGVRSWITVVLESAHKEAGCKIKLEPFLQAIADSRDDVDIRRAFVTFLERLNTNTAEVREGFKKILQRKPVDEYEATVWDQIKQSRILKEEP